MPARSLHLIVVTALFAVSAPASEDYRYESLDPKSNDRAYHDAADFDELLELRGLRASNARLDALVAELAGRVAFPSPDDYIDYRFYLIEDPSPIAFSLADGQVYLHTGLVARLTSANQVAAVLLHEVHHVAAHHQIAEGRERQRSQTAGGFATYVTDLFITGPLLSVITSEELSKVVTRFDPAKEKEADLQAARMLADAGLDPCATVDVLRAIASDVEFEAPRILGSFTSVEGIEARRQRLSDALDCDALKLPDRVAIAADIDFEQLQRQMIEETIDDYIRLDAPWTAIAYARKLLATNESDTFALSALGDALVKLGPRPADWKLPDEERPGRWKKMTRQEILQELLATETGRQALADNLGQATEAYETALSIDPAHPRAHRGLGELLYEQGQYRLAGKHLLTYMQLDDDSVDRVIVMDMLRDIRSQLTSQVNNDHETTN